MYSDILASRDILGLNRVFDTYVFVLLLLLFSNGRQVRNIQREEFPIPDALFLHLRSTHFDNHKQNFESTKIHLIFQCLFRRVELLLFLSFFYLSLSKKERALRPNICRKSECRFSVHLGQN